MRHLLCVLGVAAVASGCDWYFGEEHFDPTPDARVIIGVPDASLLPDGFVNGRCLSPENRTHDCRYDLSGTIVDFSTLAPPDLPGVQLDVGVLTAWDTIPFFPAGCPTLATVSVTGSGFFELAAAPCDSSQFPPIALFIVDDSGADLYATTASDKALDAGSEPQCAPVSMTIPVPRKVLMDDWRQQMSDDGMPDALTRGLVLYQYLDAAGNGAPGVQPTILEGSGPRFLAPGTEVRFIAADRVTLIQADATITGVSGWAIIAAGPDFALVGGSSASGAQWDEVGVLFSPAPGWIFVEDNTVDTP
jgi:hypothetical protein